MRFDCPLIKGKGINNYMLTRKTCPHCNQRPVAVNFHRNNKIYYRKFCDTCLRRGIRYKPEPPAWHRAGYSKKERCEKCGFKARHPEQLGVFYVDGNLKNNNWLNLKTICLNCTQEVQKSRLPWRQSPLISDF
jgi:hypothetical protein